MIKHLKIYFKISTINNVKTSTYKIKCFLFSQEWKCETTYYVRARKKKKNGTGYVRKHLLLTKLYIFHIRSD